MNDQKLNFGHKTAIFDMDGTLLNSMGIWRSLGINYLARQGVVVPKDLEQQLKARTLYQSASLFRSLGVRKTDKEILSGMMDVLAEGYRQAEMKPGAEDYLLLLRHSGIRMAIATTTPIFLAKPPLKRLGLWGFFDFLLDSTDFPDGKNSADIYIETARRLNAIPCQVTVYEDALHAARTAKNAGFFLVAIQDPWADGTDAMVLRQISNRYITHWSELLE